MLLGMLSTVQKKCTVEIIIGSNNNNKIRIQNESESIHTVFPSY